MISACVTSTCKRGVASAGQLVSALMDSRPQMLCSCGSVVRALH